MLRRVNKTFSKVLKNNSFHTNNLKLKDEKDEQEKFQGTEIIEKKNSYFKKNLYQNKDGEIEETTQRFKNPKKDHVVEIQRKSISTKHGEQKIENILERKISTEKRQNNNVHYTEEVKSKTQINRMTSPPKESKSTQGPVQILKREVTKDKVERTQTIVTPYKEGASIKKKGSFKTHAPVTNYTSQVVDTDRVVSQLKENQKIVKSVEKVENQNVITKHQQIHNKRTVTLETQSKNTLKEHEFRKIVEPKSKVTPNLEGVIIAPKEIPTTAVSPEDDEVLFAPGKKSFDFKEKIAFERQLKKEKEERANLKKKDFKKTSKRREFRSKNQDGRENDEESHGNKSEFGFKNNNSEGYQNRDAEGKKNSGNVSEHTFDSHEFLAAKDSEKAAKIYNLIGESMKHLHSQIYSLTSDVNAQIEVENKKLDDQVEKGLISKENASLIRKANPEVYSPFDKIPQVKSDAPVTEALETMLDIVDKLSNIKYGNVKSIEKLNAYELNEYERKGELNDSILQHYVDNTPMSAVVDEIFRTFQEKFLFDEITITPQNSDQIFEELMNEYFVGRGEAVAKYLSKDSNESNIGGNHWSQWVTPDQKRELSYAFQLKCEELAKHVDIKSIMRELNQSEEKKGNPKIDEELELHVLVQEKKILQQISNYQQNVEEFTVNPLRIDDATSLRTAGKYGKNKVMVPYERYFSRWTEELPEGSYAKKRFTQQCRSLAQNNSMTLNQKKFFMKNMFNIYKQYNLGVKGEQQPVEQKTVFEKYLPRPTMSPDKKSEFIIDYIAEKKNKLLAKKEQKK
jgi:hypothetical protein